LPDRAGRPVSAWRSDCGDMRAIVGFWNSSSYKNSAVSRALTIAASDALGVLGELGELSVKAVDDAQESIDV
jgi:hypothetical protein